jgi:septal ring-binding cell division protein DamX
MDLSKVYQYKPTGYPSPWLDNQNKKQTELRRAISTQGIGQPNQAQVYTKQLLEAANMTSLASKKGGVTPLGSSVPPGAHSPALTSETRLAQHVAQSRNTSRIIPAPAAAHDDPVNNIIEKIAAVTAILAATGEGIKAIKDFPAGRGPGAKSGAPAGGGYLQNVSQHLIPAKQWNPKTEPAFMQNSQIGENNYGNRFHGE